MSTKCAAAHEKRRVFFALWPDAATRTALVRATREAVGRSGGRPTPPDNLHITVAFLGALSAPELERALGVAPVPGEPFELTLDTLGFWDRARILWLAPRRVPAALVTLEQTLWSALAAAGFERERRAYRPHLTLVRRARAVEAVPRPVVWPVSELALIESAPERRGSSYRPLGRWPLTSFSTDDGKNRGCPGGHSVK